MNPRRTDIDWLRISAVLLVFATHSAQIFSPIDDWHIESPEKSKLLGQFTVFMAPWLMPLFMFLAGQSAWFALRTRNSARYLQERVFKLFLPLVAGTLLIVPPQVYLRRLSRGEFEGSYLDFYPQFFNGFFPTGNFSYGHLWFLAYLFLYMIVTLPLFRLIESPAGRKVLHALSRVCDWPGGILWLFLPIAAGQLLLRRHFPMTTGAIVGDWSTHAWFLTVYLLGYAMMLEPRLEKALDRDWRTTLFPGILTATVLFAFAWPGEVYARIPSTASMWYLVFWTSFTLGTWAWIVFFAGWAKSHLKGESSFVRYWSSRVYAFYVIHQTVVVIIAYYVVRWPLPIAIKFSLVLTLAFFGSLAVIEAMARIPAVRTLLGTPPPPKTRAPS